MCARRVSAQLITGDLITQRLRWTTAQLALEVLPLQSLSLIISSASSSEEMDVTELHSPGRSGAPGGGVGHSRRISSNVCHVRFSSIMADSISVRALAILSSRSVCRVSRDGTAVRGSECVTDIGSLFLLPLPLRSSRALYSGSDGAV